MWQWWGRIDEGGGFFLGGGGCGGLLLVKGIFCRVVGMGVAGLFS